MTERTIVAAARDLARECRAWSCVEAVRRGVVAALPRGSLLRSLLVHVLVLLSGVAHGSDAAVDAAAGILRLALADEPPNLNSVTTTDQISSFVLLHTNEGLLHYDRNNRLAPALALRWELDGRGARFWLRRDARWEDGSPVTARDFVFAWREVVDPANASQYAPLMFPVENARAIAAGEKAPTTLGVSATADDILDVRFDEPCAYFPALTAYTTFLPVKEDFYRSQGKRYAADAGRLLANGPYRLREWVHGASLVLEKNPLYRDAGSIRIRRIEIPYITGDPLAQLNLFLDGRIALASVPPERLRDLLAERVKLRQFVDGSLSYLAFNFREGRPTRSLALRRAVQAAVDPGELVNRVLRLPGARPTDSLFPSFLAGVEARFVDEYPLAGPTRGEAIARRHAAQARAELGDALQRPLYLLSGDSPAAMKAGEYVQARLSGLLGLEVRIDRQIFKQRLQKMVRGEFDIVLTNWGPDFDDPITFGDLLASWNPNNRGRYVSEDYDRWVAVAKSTTAARLRFDAIDRLQRRIVRDAPIIPLYENAQLYVQHPGLHGVVRSIFGGDPNLRHAWLERP